jgi:hypothetical protein
MQRAILSESPTSVMVRDRVQNVHETKHQSAILVESLVRRLAKHPDLNLEGEGGGGGRGAPSLGAVSTWDLACAFHSCGDQLERDLEIGTGEFISTPLIPSMPWLEPARGRSDKYGILDVRRCKLPPKFPPL